jgi:hypothetical protein
MTYFEGKKMGPRLNRRDAAAYLGVAASTLAVWSSTNRYNLPYVKMGRLVQYRIADLDNFIASRTVCAQVLQ